MKGILFTELLYHKVVDGSKTQTRREGSLKEINYQGSYIYSLIRIDRRQDGAAIAVLRDEWFSTSVRALYKVGEVLYLKEPYHEDDLGIVRYKFDYHHDLASHMKFKNKLFMPEKYARHYIRITDVRVERLYDISDEDCLREGVEAINTNRRKEDIHLCEDVYPDYEYYNHNSDTHAKYEYTYSAKISFFTLFRFANKMPKSVPIENIWVWVYSYELCNKDGQKT